MVRIFEIGLDGPAVFWLVSWTISKVAFQGKRMSAPFERKPKGSGDRLLAALALFTIERPQWTVEEAADALGVSATTAYRYFKQLTGSGLISPVAGAGYTLGPAIIQMDRQLQATDPMLIAARAVMVDLIQHAAEGSTVLLCRLFHDRVMCMHQVMGRGPQAPVSYERGRLMPLYRGATAKIILAHLPTRTLKSLYAHDAAEITAAGLGKNCRRFPQRARRRCGAPASASSHGEIDPGRVGIGAPIFDRDHAVLGSLSFALPERARRRSADRAPQAAHRRGRARDRTHHVQRIGHQPAKPGPRQDRTLINANGVHREDAMTFATIKLSLILFGLSVMLKLQRWRHESFRKRLKERNFTAQIMARDEECGRWFEFKDGNIRSGAGLHPAPDCKLMFKNATIGATLLMPPINWLRQINAQKDFVLSVDGPEDLTNWFAQTVMMSQSAGLKIGTRMADGSMRYCNMTNGGPVFIYVKDGKIIRMTPIDLAEDDGASFTIEARGREAHAAAQDDAGAARPEREVDRLFARPPALSDEAGRLRSERRAQSAEPRQVRLRAHLLGRGDQDRHRRDQAPEARARPRRDRGVARLAPHLGQCRLLPLGAVPLRQRDRHDARAPQSRLAGKAGTGARCITGATRCASASRRPTARSRTACRTAT